MTLRPRLFLPGLLSLAVLINAGCSESDGGLDVHSTTDPPAEVSFSGASWHRGSQLTPEEQNLLVDWFRQNPDVVGSPELEGNPVVYRAENDDRMFVWTYPAVNGGGWTRLLCRSGSFQQDTGSGSPF